ncbi:ISH4-type transposase ISNph2 (plasmid) [Natronomonas pharaonis DSM 2160]|uniref:ISH4-type transposase ISNph2 n=1 Tax=Natronomonas pharaonis (strain ATCC 35678 / DSM 2160 / CIP 103997 / JCM 8858 / NBRC 14720 / NCIMB 2260 / Gabara) TaxID=348780 RepID=Q3IM49_NATPD|nr:IS1595-like element ISNph2 family transposase [Natronomonas pharaonis]CAI50814.1 ISH4-type transposase ISNph2 [Natronomonas pharaonis DSM 2160]
MFPFELLSSEASAANLLEQVRWREGLCCPRCRSESVIKHGSYREYQRYLCKDCDRTFNDKTGTIFAHAKIGLDKLLFAFYSLLRFNTSIRQLDAEIDVSYRSLRRRVEQFARTLDAPAINLVGPVEIDEFYVSAGKKGRKRDRESRSRALSKRGRGTYEEDKPPVFTLVDRGTGQRYVVPAKSADEATVRLLLENHEKESLTVYTDGFRAYDPLDDDEDFHRESVIHGDGEYVDGDAHVNTCESHASLARRWLSPHRGVSKDKLTAYLRPFQLRRRILRKPGREALKQIIREVL